MPRTSPLAEDELVPFSLIPEEGSVTHLRVLQNPICICGGVRRSRVLSKQMECPGHWLGTKRGASFPVLVTRRCPLSAWLGLYGDSKQGAGREVLAPCIPACSLP